MKEELELQLFAKYPNILKLYKNSGGLECDDGWYNLLDQCMEEIQYLCDSFSTEDRKVEVVADQIKEKFGTLRFYVTLENASNLESRIIHRSIDAAEKDSADTCEVTGNNGKACMSNVRRLYKTLCQEEARSQDFRALDPKVQEFWNIAEIQREPKN